MKIDVTRTKIIRLRHEAGVIRLNKIFSWDPAAMEMNRKAKHSRPKARRLKRKAARRARRVNR